MSAKRTCKDALLFERGNKNRAKILDILKSQESGRQQLGIFFLHGSTLVSSFIGAPCIPPQA